MIDRVKSYYNSHKQPIITIGIIIGALGVLYFLLKKFVFTTFDDFIEIVFKNEGGYSADAQDIGGITMMGISAVYNPEYADKIKNKTLTKAEAKSIYKRKYYDPLHVGMINDARLRFSVFDMAINAGISTGVKLLQGVIGVKADGKLTSEQVSKANLLQDSGYNVLGKYVEARKTHYNNIVKKNPSQEKFLKGWIKRTESYKHLFS